MPGILAYYWKGIIGWEESKMEEKHNQDLERLQKTCTGCMGTLWKPHTSSQWEGRTPSPTGRQRIQRERWIFAGLDAPLWGAGEFRIGMIGTEEEPTMSSGEEHPPPTYITPSEDEMDTTGPRTPQIGGPPEHASQEAWRAFMRPEASPSDAYWGAPPSLLREATGEFDLREGPFLQLPPPHRLDPQHVWRIRQSLSFGLPQVHSVNPPPTAGQQGQRHIGHPGKGPPSPPTKEGPVPTRGNGGSC